MNPCAITGASGFVGRSLARQLRAKGGQVIEWKRSVAPSTESVSFRLGQNVDANLFRGARTLIHCAYDFAPRRWQEIVDVNLTGSEKLFQAASEAGVQRVIFISSLSAFPGCRSLYGKAKLEIEKRAQSIGAWIIRPGLVYGNLPGGMFGRLVAQVSNARLLPIISGGTQTQYLLHEEDLGNLVLHIAEGQVPATTEPISAAHETGLALKEILTQLAETLGKRISFVPIPWQMAWLGLKTLELAGFNPNFKSDSLISIIYQNPRPSFALFKSLGFHCRPFRPSQLNLIPSASPS